MLDVMSDLAATAKPVGIVAKMARRVGVALTISIGVALLLLILWKSPKSALFFRTITLGLAATTVFSLFEVWPRRLPRGHERWILQVVAVGAAMPLTLFVMHRQGTSPGAPPARRAMDGGRDRRAPKGSLCPQSEAHVRTGAQ
jgi:hypothetical protein